MYMDRQQWDEFVRAAGGDFLQSWAWGELQEKMGLKIWRVEEKDAVALVLKRGLPLGRSWLYVPRGPVGNWGSELQRKLVEIGEQEGAIFVRIDPALTSPPAPLLRKERGEWRKAEREVQPKNTLILELGESEEEVLAAMHHKTRYNIRLAQKKGVTVRFSKDERDVEHFLRLARAVHGRGKFSYHPDEYYKAMVEVLGRAGMCEIALAEYQGDVLAAHIIVYFGTTATYAHGASSSKLREVMAPNLLQWETIKRAKARGYTQYDFFGVAPQSAAGTAGQAPHPWAGVTRFKLGFGGRRIDYIGAYDLVLSDGMYHVFNAARRLRFLLR